MAVFPEMTLTGYSLEDLVLQDAVLDDVERALATVVEGTADLLPLIVLGAPLRHRNRIYNCAVVVHRGAILGVVPKSYPPTYREFYEGRQLASGVGERGEIRVGGAAVPFGTDLLFAAERRPRPRGPRRGVRGHVDPDPAERRGGAGGRDRPAQPVRQPDHRRPGGGPQAAVPLGVLALPGRLRLLRRRPGRVVDRPGVGRPDHDLRERRAARRDRALRGRRPPRGGRRRPRPAAPGAAPHGHVRRQPARAPRRLPQRRLHARSARRRPRPAAHASSATRSSPPTSSASTSTATRPTTSRSPGCTSGCARSATRRS